MKAILITGCAVGALGVVALFAVEQSAGGTDQAAGRIVQAPALPETTAAGSAGAVQHDMAGATSTSASGQAPAAGGWSRVSVGFTLVDGKLYVVTAESKSAAGVLAATIAKGGAPAFECHDPGVAATGTETQFAAWELQSYGGDGALPPMNSGGQLLTAKPGSKELACALTNSQGK